MRGQIAIGLLLLSGWAAAGDAEVPLKSLRRLPLPFLDQPAPTPLTDEETALVRTCVEHLDADAFKARETAEEKLVKLGPRILDLLDQWYEKVRTDGTRSPEAEERLQRAYASICGREVDLRREHVRACLNRAVKESPNAFRTTGAEVRTKLNTRVNMVFPGGTYEQALTWVEAATHVPVVLDPEAAIVPETADNRLETVNWNGCVPYQMFNQIAQWRQLRWVCYGGAAVFTTEARARALERSHAVIRLPSPVESDEPPWSLQETRVWIKALCPRIPSGTDSGIWIDTPPYTPLTLKILEPGQVDVEGDGQAVTELQRLVEASRPMPLRERLPAVKTLVQFLSQPMGTTFDERQLGTVLDQLSAGRVSCALTMSRNVFSCTRPQQTVSEWIREARKGSSSALFPCLCNGKPALRNTGSDSENAGSGQVVALFSIDLKLTAQHGVSTGVLDERLRDLLRESPFPSSGQRIRDIWVGFADLWTILRMEELVASIGHSKEYLVPPPPEPRWFMKELGGNQ